MARFSAHGRVAARARAVAAGAPEFGRLAGRARAAGGPRGGRWRPRAGRGRTQQPRPLRALLVRERDAERAARDRPFRRHGLARAERGDDVGAAHGRSRAGASRLHKAPRTHARARGTPEDSCASQLTAMYAIAVLHKMNDDFWDPTTSCSSQVAATVFAQWGPGGALGLPGIARAPSGLVRVVVRSSPAAALILETALAVLIGISTHRRGAERCAVIGAQAFHLMLAMPLPPGSFYPSVPKSRGARSARRSATDAIHSQVLPHLPRYIHCAAAARLRGGAGRPTWGRGPRDCSRRRVAVAAARDR